MRERSENEGRLPALALWYRRAQRQPVIDKRPALELHVNLWRRTGHKAREKDINYLDLGIQIHELRDLTALQLYVPFSLDDGPVEDLGYRLRQREIASAVFNEVLDVEDGQECQPSFFIRKNGDHFLTVHPIDEGSDIQQDSAGQGTILIFDENFCSKLQSPGEHYMRIRFKLNNRAAEIFSSDVSSEDGFLLSSITTSEITEIRINEARSIPEAVQKRAKEGVWRSPQITAIHYFLVREISFDLVASHASFRKIRRMEPEWDAYLGGEFPDGSARNMLIYHWRKSGDGREGDVGDFVTLAKFRRSKGNILLYIFLVVFFGSLGSGLHSSFSFLIERPKAQEFTWMQLFFPPTGWAYVAATGWIALITGLALTYQKWPIWPRRR
ncbi:hypothetical protein [Ensifer aridi]|uniref:hypothetical protein n=1 Tax=Ensifer aridi TaxID=1708715 RepID=UPI00111C28AF|nr:hypothetical protein [Ensifer aridi]